MEKISLNKAIIAVIDLSLSYRKFLHGKNAEKQRASENLYTELKDVSEVLDDKKYPNSVLHVKIEKNDGSVETLYFMNWSLNHDFYDSLIFSGQINFLEPKIQQAIQNLFKMIKIHNEYLICIDEIMDREDSTIVPKSAHKYCKWLDKNKVRIKTVNSTYDERTTTSL